MGRLDSMEKFAGQKFLNNRDEEVEPSTLQNVELIGLLFGAYWCENSRKFMLETLVELYNYINTREDENAPNENNLKFQVIYVNNDQSKDAFDRFRQQMPWVALKFDEQSFCYDLRK